MTLAEGVTLTLISTESTAKSKEIRAPAIDGRGTPKVCRLFSTQFGTERPALNWATKTARPLPKAEPTSVVRVCCFKALLEPDDWFAKSRNIKATTRDWVLSLRVPQAGVVDLFNPRRSECGNILSVNVRVHAPHVKAIVDASGIRGFLARELPSDGTTTMSAFGNIKWLRKVEDESGSDFLKRARLEAESTSDACHGLAFSNSGSIGLRFQNGRCETSWRASGLPKEITITQFAKWLIDHNWGEVRESSMRRRLQHRGASFTFRGVNPEGANSIYSLEVPQEDGGSVFVDIEPFSQPPDPHHFILCRIAA